MGDPKIDPNDSIEAIWCVNSETGEQVLVELRTEEFLARKDKDGNIVWQT